MRRSLLHLLCIFTLVLVGCKSEDPHPEQKDPIYKDLKARADSYEKSYLESKEQIVTLSAELEKAEDNSIEKRNIRRDLAKARAAIVGHEQLHRYYKIRAERRRLVGRKAYREAFAKGQEWPDPREYSDYQVNMRLHEINLNWNARVPKLQDRSPAKSAEKAKPAPSGH